MSRGEVQSGPDLAELSGGLAEQFVPFPWGFSDLAIDADQLQEGRVAIESARGILRSGMPFAIASPETQPEPLDVPAEARNEIIVLAPIVWRPGQGEAGRTMLCLRLASELTGAHGGVEVARVIEKQSDGRVLLDHAYVPPTLCVRSNPILTRYMRELLGLVRARREALQHRIAGRDRFTIADTADFLLLQTLNRFEPVLSHLDQLPVVHPERLYVTCLMLIGELSTFGAGSGRATALPSYRRDDLEDSFRPLADLWRQSLSITLSITVGQGPDPLRDLLGDRDARPAPLGPVLPDDFDPFGGNLSVDPGTDADGPLGRRAKGPPVASTGELQEVELGASAPRAVSPGQSFVARFAGYLQHLEAEVRQKLDEINRGRGEALLGMTTCRWRVGTPVSVRMSGDYFAVEPGDATFTWNGSRNILSFRVRTNADAPCGWTQLCAEVSIEGVPVALLPIDIEITPQPGATKESRVTGTPARSAFASYAAKDSLEVLARISAVSAYDSGLDVFYDWLDLLAGEDWRVRLEGEIARRDVLLLFWSRNARESEWVEWEWRKAVEKKGLAAIRPMPIEPPDLAPPPEELKSLNFRDRYLVAQDAARRIAHAAPTARDGQRFV